MPHWLARFIRYLLETGIWFLIGVFAAGVCVRPLRNNPDLFTAIAIGVPVAFAILGPPLWNRHIEKKLRRGSW